MTNKLLDARKVVYTLIFSASVVIASIVISKIYSAAPSQAPTKHNISAAMQYWMDQYGVSGPATSKLLTNISFKNGERNAVTLQEFYGSDVIVAVWATWCSSCAEELPYFNKQFLEFKRQGIHIVPISVDETGLLPAKRYFEVNNIDMLPLYSNPTINLLEELNIGPIPALIFVNKEGYEVGRKIGPLPSAIVSSK